MTKELIKLLLDPGADVASRDDAASDLAGSDEPAAIEALATVATDADAPVVLQETAGESLGECWVRTGHISVPTYLSLTKLAKQEVDGLLALRWQEANRSRMT